MNDLASASPAAFRRPPPPVWPLTVVDAFDVTPRMRRVRLVGELDAFRHRPGQDLVLRLPQPDGSCARRHYTVRAFDAVEHLIDIDVVLHGDTPGVRWARGARLGDPIDAEGPRGRTALASGADWRLFIADETGIPAVLAMIEALPAQARAMAVFEVHGAEDRVPIAARATVEAEWFARRGPPQPAKSLLVERLSVFAPPKGDGHVYLLAETSAVRAIRQGLIARGFPARSITAEGYWRPGRVGGHDHVFDGEPHRLRQG